MQKRDVEDTSRAGELLSFLKAGRNLPGKIRLQWPAPNKEQLQSSQGAAASPGTTFYPHPASAASTAAAAAAAYDRPSRQPSSSSAGQSPAPTPPPPAGRLRFSSSSASSPAGAVLTPQGSKNAEHAPGQGGTLYPASVNGRAGAELSQLQDQQQGQQQQQQHLHAHGASPPFTSTSSSPSTSHTPSRAHSNNGVARSWPHSNRGSTTNSPLQITGKVLGHRLEKFNKLLAAPVVDLHALRELSWNGIPHHLRPECWRLLVGYAPADRSQAPRVLKEQRAKYTRMIPELYDRPDSERSEAEKAALRQVIVDAPRTAPHVPFFHFASVQKSLERLLYIWGINHPESGYVQGMNDLVTPFYTVFLSEHLSDDLESWQPDYLPMNVMLDVEADCYWCLCKLISGVQDQYTYAQPGIQRAVFKIHELIGLVDKDLAKKMTSEGVDYIQFAWRWINCLLLRELPFRLSLRLWDTYLAEDTQMCEFLIYACGSFLEQWSKELMSMDFQDMIMFLQKPPTASWDEATLEVVLSRAIQWRYIWDGSALRQPMRPEHYIHGGAPAKPKK